MNNLKENIFSILWLIIWIYLAYNNSEVFFYWVGFFSSLFIGFWIINKLTNKGEVEKFKKQEERHTRKIVEQMSGQYIHHSDED